MDGCLVACMHVCICMHIYIYIYIIIFLFIYLYSKEFPSCSIEATGAHTGLRTHSYNTVNGSLCTTTNNDNHKHRIQSEIGRVT